MVGIVIDAKYAQSLWCEQLHESLVKNLRKNRIPFCEFFDVIDTNLDAVFIIASHLDWTVATIRKLNKFDIRPILLCNQYEKLPNCLYSCISSDISASTKTIIDSLKEKNKKRIAFYGVNINSISDINRLDSLFTWNEQYFDNIKIFNNETSLKKCFDDFFLCVNDFDVILCANDFAAVSLVRNLKEKAPDKLDALTIISCAHSYIADQYRENIQTLNMNFEQYGKAAIYVYNALKKNSCISEMSVKVMWLFEKQTKKTFESTISLNTDYENDCFYNDEELLEMMIVEKTLSSLEDDIDKKIISLFIAKETIEKISEECFLSPNGIKYKLNRIIEYSGAKSKTELQNVLKKYIGDK